MGLSKIVAVNFMAFMCIGVSSSAFADKTLYEKLGGDTGVTSIVKDMLEYTLADSRIAHTFSESNVPRVEKLLVEQICELTNGPCTYTGRDMKKTHRGLELTSAHFNALVENLQKAMDDNKVPFRIQNKLLAVLAPMHDDVIEKPTK